MISKKLPKFFVWTEEVEDELIAAFGKLSEQYPNVEVLSEAERFDITIKTYMSILDHHKLITQYSIGNFIAFTEPWFNHSSEDLNGYLYVCNDDCKLNPFKVNYSRRHIKIYDENGDFKTEYAVHGFYMPNILTTMDKNIYISEDGVDWKWTIEVKAANKPDNYSLRNTVMNIANEPVIIHMGYAGTLDDLNKTTDIRLPDELRTYFYNFEVGYKTPVVNMMFEFNWHYYIPVEFYMDEDSMEAYILLNLDNKLLRVKISINHWDPDATFTLSAVEI